MEEEMDPSSVDSQHAQSLTERNYLGLSYCSSVDSSTSLTLPEDERNNHNMKATELRLGLPGSQSPGREPDLCLRSPKTLTEKPLFPLVPSKERMSPLLTEGIVSRNKRGFSETTDEFSEVKGSMDGETNWMLNGPAESPQSVRQGSNQCKAGISVMIPSRTRVSQPAAKQDVPENFIKDPSVLKTRTCQSGGLKNNNDAPAAKAQVVGWPPIRLYRKNSLATTSKNNHEVDGKPILGPLFMKVSMDGAPYLRKVDLKTYSSYQELSSALKKMFSCFTLRQCGSHVTPGREMLSEIKLKDLLHDSEYVLTYEDKDGDWMLVGDVPWGMFIDSCTKLKIMKSSDAIGLDV